MTDDERLDRNQRIRKEYAKTGSIRKTTEVVGCTRKTVRRVLRGETRARLPRRSKERKSKLDPYRHHLKRLIQEDHLTAILAFDELRTMGFDGGYAIVKRLAATFRPSRSGKGPTMRMEHPPGEEGQMDWSPYGVVLGTERTVVQGFSFVLPFSAWRYLQFAFDQTLETLTGLHDQAFDLTQAVPHRMSYDNMTTVGRHIGDDEVWINPTFATWASPYGFEIFLTRPGKPKDHATVERSHQYNENNFLRRHRFRFDDLADLNRKAAQWCVETANMRIHGTTRKRPIDQLRIERTYMLPLPSARPEPFRVLTRKVGADFLVAVDTNAYSVAPRYIEHEAKVRLFADRLEIWFEGEDEAHAVHVRSRERHQPPFVLPEHAEEYKRITPSRRLLESAFLRLGEGARTYYDGLCAQRGRGAGYHLKRILRLADRYGESTVIAAMAHAARYGNYSADAVSRVISGQPAPSTLPETTATGDVPMPSDRVRRWLEALDVEERDLDDFDGIVDRQGVDDDEG